MRVIAAILQVVGLVSVSAGAALMFGNGAGLITGGLSSLLTGVVLERETTR